MDHRAPHRHHDRRQRRPAVDGERRVEVGIVADLGGALHPERLVDAGDRTNYFLRETVRREKRANPGGTTAVSCCGANPGMVGWFVKQATVNLAGDLGHRGDMPASREAWARLMRDLGVKGVHIAERDTQRAAAATAACQPAATFAVGRGDKAPGRPP